MARFADDKSAWLAHQVLDAWPADCRSGAEGDVGPLRAVAVTNAIAEAYRVGTAQQATDLGIVRTSSYLSVVALVGPTADVPADSAPARAAVKRIAATF